MKKVHVGGGTDPSLSYVGVSLFHSRGGPVLEESEGGASGRRADH